MNKQVMHGEGTFFFANGDMLDGTFVDHKVLALLLALLLAVLALPVQACFTCLLYSLYQYKIY